MTCLSCTLSEWIIFSLLWALLYVSLIDKPNVNSPWKLMSLLGLSLLDKSLASCLQWTCRGYGLFHTAGLEASCCLCALLFVRQHYLNLKLFCLFFLLYTWKNTVVLLWCCILKGAGKRKRLYWMWAVKPLSEITSETKLFSYMKHLMSFCSNMLKHFKFQSS